MNTLLEFKKQLAAAFETAINEAASGTRFCIVVETSQPELVVAVKRIASHSDVVLFSTYASGHKRSIDLLACDADAVGLDVAIQRFVDINLRGWVSELRVANLDLSDSLDAQSQLRVAKFAEDLWQELPELVDWDSCVNGELMLQLAFNAEVDQKRLVGAAADCARLVLHLTGFARRPLRSIETCQAYARGLGSKAKMDAAIRATEDVLVESQSTQYDANLAACCKANVVESVVMAALIAASLQTKCGMEQTVEKAVRSLVLAACANLVRANIKLTPVLEAEIVRHNSARTPWA